MKIGHVVYKAESSFTGIDYGTTRGITSRTHEKNTERGVSEERKKYGRDNPLSSLSTSGGIITMQDDIQRIRELDEENPKIKDTLPPLYKQVVEQVTG
ncbi:MAG: hypothetical protein R6V35_03655 [Candidatus Nanohaloarchaea archaeon]